MKLPIPTCALPFAGALVALALIAGGCGSDDDTTAEAEATAAETPSIDPELLDQAMTAYDDYVEKETAAFSARPRSS